MNEDKIHTSPTNWIGAASIAALVQGLAPIPEHLVWPVVVLASAWMVSRNLARIGKYRPSSPESP